MKHGLYGILKARFLLDEDAIKNWRFIVFIIGLAIVMIANTQRYEQKVFRIAELTNEVKELRSEFVDRRSELMKLKMESTVARQMEARQILPSTVPPTKIKVIKEVEKEPYDFKADKNGELFWSRLVSSIDKKYPFNLSKFNKKLTLDDVENLVDEILTQFKDLIENKGLWKEMWADDKKPRKEKAAQRLLFAVAYSYCKANNLDISPEADSGNGPVDFKVSQGFEQKVLVEVKLSSNGKLLHGYEKQLEIYRNGDDTDRAFFVIVDIGHLGEKYQKVQQARIAAENEGLRASKIIHIDAQQKDSASIRI